MIKILFSICLLASFQVLGQIPTDSLVAYYPFNGNANDHSATGNNASVVNATLTTDRFGSNNSCYKFDGVNQYIQFPDHDSLSIATTQKLSISIWMRPDTLNFENTEGDGYVHWMGKGSSGQQEWLMRMYNYNSTRPNRTSCYAFNLSGGLGSGSYVEEALNKGEWMHLTAVYNFPTNEIKIYKNGVLRDTDYFTDYSVIPGNGTAPFRIGTRDFNSYFKGAIDDIRIYSRILSASEISALYNETAIVSGVKNSLDNSVMAYPNPSNGLLMIEFTNYQSSNITIELLNPLGETVLKRTTAPGTVQIKFNDLESQPFYFLKIIDNQSGKVSVKKILIQ